MAEQELAEKLASVKAAVQCGVCVGTMKEASMLSGCGHTFCRSCIDEALRVKAECPVCRQPAWCKDIQPHRHVDRVMEHTAYSN